MTSISALGFWSPKKLYPEKSSARVLSQVPVLGGSGLRPLSLSSLPRDTGQDACWDWEHWSMRECKTSSEGKKGRARHPLRTRRTLVPCARFCLLSVEACSQGPQFSARWRHVTLLGSWSFAATCLAQASPAAFAFRLAPRPASQWIVFILFLQPQLLPDSFQSVTPQLSI